MKFLIFALCVCAASAASIDYKSFGSYKPTPYTPYRQAVNTGKYVATPVAKTEYNAGQYVAPVKTYKNVVVVPTPVINTRTVEIAQEVVPPVVAAPLVAAPVVSATPVYDAAAVVVEPLVKSVSVIPKTYSAVAKPVYTAPKTYNYENDFNAAILRSEIDVAADGFNYVYETANGIAASASGSLKNVDNAAALVVEGSYQYTAPDGTPVQFTYTADENGYQPRSDLLPVAPPVPEAILRSLEYIRTHAKPENY